MEEGTIILNNAGGEYETLTLKSKSGWVEMNVDYVDKDGDVEVSMHDRDDYVINIYLNQTQVKALIAYLQKQVK